MRASCGAFDKDLYNVRAIGQGILYSSLKRGKLTEIFVMRHSDQRLKDVNLSDGDKEELGSPRRIYRQVWENADGLAADGAFAVLPTVRYLRIFFEALRARHESPANRSTL